MTMTSLPKPDGLLFDLDGVIADVGRSYRECIVRTARDFACIVTHEEIDVMKRRGNANNDWALTQDLLIKNGKRPALSAIVRRFQGHYHGSYGRPGLCEGESLLIESGLLREITARFPSAIVTGRPRKEADSFLERYGISHCFRLIVAMEDAPLKPSHVGVQRAIDKLGLICPWMVGDTPDDMKAASAAGIVAIGVVPGIESNEEREALIAAGAVLVLSDINDIRRYLN